MNFAWIEQTYNDARNIYELGKNLKKQRKALYKLRNIENSYTHIAVRLQELLRVSFQACGVVV